MGVCHVFGPGATESGSVMTCLVERSLHRLVIIGDGGDNKNHAKNLDSSLYGEDRVQQKPPFMYDAKITTRKRDMPLRPDRTPASFAD